MPLRIPNEADAAAHADQAELDAVDIDTIVAGFAGAGVLNGCEVTAQSTPDMTLSVAAGSVVSVGTWLTHGTGNVTVTTAHATLPRFDLVVVTSAGTRAVRAGTAAASPVFPTPTAGDVLLAAVYVPAGATAIGSTQIVDKRVMLPSPSWYVGRDSADATSPAVILNKSRANGAASNNDGAGLLRAQFLNASGTLKTAAEIEAIVTDTTNASEDASLILRTIVAGTLADRLSIVAGVLTLASGFAVSAGAVTLPDGSVAPAALVQGAAVVAYQASAQSITTGGPNTLVYETEVEDALSEYNTTTGVFTPDASGWYLVAAGVAANFIQRYLLAVWQGTTTELARLFDLSGGPGGTGCVVMRMTGGTGYTLRVHPVTNSTTTIIGAAITYLTIRRYA